MGWLLELMLRTVPESPVDFSDGTRDYLQFVYMENSDFGPNGIYVGRIYERYEYEGNTGNSSGNHLHITAGKGFMKNGGWICKRDCCISGCGTSVSD